MAKAAAAPAPTGPFTGFRPAALGFLRDLAANQTREWFQENKAVYEREVKAPLGALVDALAFAFAAHEIPLGGDAKRSLFRIHRDVRFSKDKRPYKTNAGAVLSRDGSKSTMGMLYVQIGGEDGSFMAVGFYAPDPAATTALRRGVADRPERWIATLEALSEAGLALSMGQAQSRIPRGFEAYAGTEIAESLKLRNFVVSRPIADARLGDVELIDDIVEFAAAARPLLEFGWSSLDRARRAA